MTEINEIIIAIQRATLVPNKNRRGETVFNFQDHFLKDLERRVAAFIEKETGQLVQPFADDHPRQGIRNGEFFNAKSREVFISGFIERLTAHIRETILSLRQEVLRQHLSYEIGLNLCVGCGDWEDGALLEMEWTKVVSS
jgi:hypothetical protein